ncbi:RNA polymerase sigma factor [Microscilla marina]|uniref:RNA polymerase sigma-70 factor, ECF subfamily n=1 Tax=Microscilla marina ATCC 23134 TaxID=313606 RepID=A1ZJQ1_MICM2|nr:RNA polymerase sigma factor [Microscilla marina]EAY29354.1 RNA polymerase sigma-70 factor, ECF subfamily [Microscilla marina ATCC 23134]
MSKLSSEKALVKGCRKGKRQAQQKVYELYSPKMFAVCLRYVRHQFDAEEVMTNGFLKVFSKIDQFKEEGSFEGWIRRIVVNEALNHLRKNKRHQAEVDIENISEAAELASAEDNLNAQDLMKCIDQLPEGYRTVFNLYAIEGYSHKEIGEQLGISTNTSKSQLSRARVLLQKYVRNQEKKTYSIDHE